MKVLGKNTILDKINTSDAGTSFASSFSNYILIETHLSLSLHMSQAAFQQESVALVNGPHIYLCQLAQIHNNALKI